MSNLRYVPSRFVLASIAFLAFIFLPKTTNAVVPALLDSVVNGSKLYTYDTACDTSKGLSPQQGFIIPDGVGTIDTLYIHFHSSNTTLNALCNAFPGQGLCAVSTALNKTNKRAAIILSHEQSSSQIDQATRECMLTEAKEKINYEAKLITQEYTLIAEGVGSEHVLKFLEQGFEASKIILFGACSADTCEKISKLQTTGQVLIYAMDSELTKVTTLYSQNLQTVFALLMPGINDPQTITSLCYLDHVLGNTCNAKAQGITIPLSTTYGIGASCVHDVTNSDCKNNLDCEDSSIDGPDNFCVCSTNQQCADAYGNAGNTTELWECIDGSGEDKAFALHYCKSNTNKIFYPIQKESIFKPDAYAASLLGDLARGYNQTPLTEEQLLALMQKPNPKIKIPGLSFSDLAVNGKLSSDEDGSTYIEVPFLGEYASAVYNYLILIAGVICVARIIVAGFIYTAPDTSGESKSAAIAMIKNAVIGLGLVVGSYTILYAINPDLVAFKNLKVFYTRGEPYFEPAELPQTTAGGYVAGEAEVSAEAAKSIGGLLGGSNSQPACSAAAAQAAANSLNSMKICVGPVHCAYTATRFLQYIGCNSKTLTGNANYMVGNMEQEGWVAMEITPENADKLPVGALWFPGHAGVSTGNGTMFESTIGGAFDWAADKKGCPQLSGNASESNCGYCAKLKGQEPWQRNLHYKNGVGKNQGWKTSGVKNIRQFRLIIYPAPANVSRPPLGCCTFSGGKKNLSSKLFCQQVHIKKSATGKIVANDWSETMWDKLKNTPQSCPTK